MKNLLFKSAFHQCVVLMMVLGVTTLPTDRLFADDLLFTTQDDFTGWGGFDVIAPQAAPDLDGSGTNGLASGGGAGTAGSLSVSDPNEAGDFIYGFSQGLQGNAALIAALGTSGDIVFDHTKPADGNYFQLGAVLNYDGHFDQTFGSEVDNLDGTFTTTIPYTFVPGDVSTYFQIGFILNSDADLPFTLDNIRVENVVPEPASMALAGLFGICLLSRRRLR